jgi:hypothetical protein
MFVVVICGGPDDGEKIGLSGWPTYGVEPPYKFENYSDAQEFIEGRTARVNDGDYGKGATLNIDEIEGDIYDCH